jgi:glutamine synthetase
MEVFAEYIWIDGTEPTRKLRSKTKILSTTDVVSRTEHTLDIEFEIPQGGQGFFTLPLWGFDGSSTNQAEGSSSDCILVPVCAVPNPLMRDHIGVLVLCEVYRTEAGADGKIQMVPHSTNTRRKLVETATKHAAADPWFGIEQEYTLFNGDRPLGWPERGYPPPQGPFYCGVGADEVFGRNIVEEHAQACVEAGLKICGTNAEVMPGQWEFQIGTADPITVSDHLWLARFLLYRIAEKYNVSAKLDPKPMNGDWNGAGAHTNFSTKQMREGEVISDVEIYRGIDLCENLCIKLGAHYAKHGFPAIYGDGYEKRLTGRHETCSWKDFRYGVGDRTASIRIPLHVHMSGAGYIEDRRPCANIDPYQVCEFLIRIACE